MNIYKFYLILLFFVLNSCSSKSNFEKYYDSKAEKLKQHYQEIRHLHKEKKFPSLEKYYEVEPIISQLISDIDYYYIHNATLEEYFKIDKKIIELATGHAGKINLDHVNKVLQRQKVEKEKLQLKLIAVKSPISHKGYYEYDNSDTLFATINKWVDEIIEESEGKYQDIYSEINGLKFKANYLGKEFPDFPFEVKDINGKKIKISDYKGKYLLVDFWGTWCKPCVAEFPMIKILYSKYDRNTFEVLGIALDKKSRVVEYVNEKKIVWNQICAEKGWADDISKIYGIRSIPTKYLLDKNGKVITNFMDKFAEKIILEKKIDKSNFSSENLLEEIIKNVIETEI